MGVPFVHADKPDLSPLKEASQSNKFIFIARQGPTEPTYLITSGVLEEVGNKLDKILRRLDELNT